MVLDELLRNAIKYTPKGNIKVSLQKKDNQLELSVSDTGIGIPPEELKEVIVAEVRGSNVGDIPGSGLGLSIESYTIQTLMQGKFSIESTLGVGTIVTIRIPIK